MNTNDVLLPLVAISVAEDCLGRAADGLEGDAWERCDLHYALDQIDKATQSVHKAYQLIGARAGLQVSFHIIASAG